MRDLTNNPELRSEFLDIVASQRPSAVPQDPRAIAITDDDNETPAEGAD